MQGAKKAGDVKKQVGRWSPEQHQRFMAAIAVYGKDWKKVEERVGTRTGSQVRSHAQKFFNKLLKIENQKKSGESRDKKHDYINQHQGSQSQNSFMRQFHDETNITPIELVALIEGESQKDNNNKVNIKNFQKKLKQNLQVIQEQSNEEKVLENLKRQKSYKSMNNILQAYQTVKQANKNTELENQSFLVGLVRHYKKYFSKGGRFQNLIDFGNPTEVQHLQKSIRKKSFTLPEGVDGDEDDLNERKKRIICESVTSKLTEQQRQNYQEFIKQHNKQNPKQWDINASQSVSMQKKQ